MCHVNYKNVIEIGNPLTTLDTTRIFLFLIRIKLAVNVLMTKVFHL